VEIKGFLIRGGGGGEGGEAFTTTSLRLHHQTNSRFALEGWVGEERSDERDE